MTDYSGSESEALKVIESWDEFEKEVIALNCHDYKNLDRLSRRALSRIMLKLQGAYYTGAVDEVDRRLRWEQIGILELHDMPHNFLCSEDKMNEKLTLAKGIKREVIEVKMKEREKELAELEYWSNDPPAHGSKKRRKKKTKKRNKKKRFSLTKLERKIAADKCMVSPRSYNYLSLKSKKDEGEIILPCYSHKAEALIDLLFHHIAENVGYGTAEGLPAVTTEIIKSVTENPKSGPSNFGRISFNTSEIRKRLNVSRDWTDKKIVEAARELRDKAIVARNIKIFADENGKYKVKDTLEGGILGAFGIRETKKIAPRTKNIQHRIHFFPTAIVGLLFYNDAVRQRFSLMPTDSAKIPQRSFYRMKPQLQKLYRYLSLWDYTILTIEMAKEILDYSKKTDSIQIRERVTCYLNEMEEAGFIKGWMRPTDRKGNDVRWIIGVNKNFMKLINEQNEINNAK